MTPMSLVWIVVFILATLLFFGAAIVITILGTMDLKNLLKKSDSEDRSAH